jgi:hypothetical protein
VANASQINSDANFVDLTPPKGSDDATWINSDTAGDACDSDDDNDGLPDASEGVACNATGGVPSALLRDTDGDRALDGAECAIGTNPADAASSPSVAQCVAASGAAGIGTDTDADGLKDYAEFCYYNSNPNSANTDGDGCGDAREVASINSDLVVTSADLGSVAAEFGANYPIGSYKSDFDMNKDGSVTSLDLGFVASKFGACP